MAQKLLSYSGITTKSKAMISKLFHEQDYEEMMQCPNVRDFVLYLKSSEAFVEYFDHMNENNVHRGEVEKVLKTALYENFESLYQFSDAMQKKQLILVYYRYETQMLSDLLKKLYNPEVSVDWTTYQRVLSNHIRIPIEQLYGARSLEEFTSLLVGTPYEHVFTMFLHEGKPSLFEVLMHLNNFYYKMVWKKKDSVFDKKENEAFTACLGTKIDVNNIMNIYRCKKYYQVDAVKILSILIPINYKLKKDEVEKLIHASSIQEFVSVLQTTDYHIKKDMITQDDMECDFYRKISHAYEESKRKNPLSMAPIFHYLYKKERELDNLTTLLECIRYQIKPEKMREFLMSEMEQEVIHGD